MYRKIITGIIILLFAAMPALAGTVQLPKTGQTISYATGDDGDLEMGVAWPDTRFSDSGNTVKDNLTGLVWTKNTNLYNYTLSWQAALDYVAGMNAGTHPNFGYTDWRLPNVNELKSLTDNSRYNPGLPQGHPFTNVQSGYYWSSTTGAYGTGGALVVSMRYGFVGSGDKSGGYSYGYFYAWPVRSGQCGSFGDSVICLPKTGQTISYATGDDGDLEMGVAWPDTRFTDNLDNTAKDNLTGLVWTKNANLPNGTLTWQAALDYVAGMNAGTHPNFGYTDWRLPNVNELNSLTDNSKYVPALPQGHPFINVQSGGYWSSTTDAYGTGHAWVVSMNYGGVSSDLKSDYFIYAWPVRSGQGGGSFGSLVISKSGNGMGTVTSDPSGIDCGSDCSESYDIATQVTLHAAADTGSVFTGWSGEGCSGTGDCIVSIDGALSVTAEFQVQTLITLSSFTSVAKAGQVMLAWSTESEIANAGFNLYRSDSEGGEYAKINGSLISAKGSPTQGASYEFIDTNVQNRKTHYYKLEDIDLNGTSTFHREISATPRWIYGIGK